MVEVRNTGASPTTAFYFFIFTTPSLEHTHTNNQSMPPETIFSGLRFNPGFSEMRLCTANEVDIHTTVLFLSLTYRQKNHFNFRDTANPCLVFVFIILPTRVRGTLSLVCIYTHTYRSYRNTKAIFSLLIMQTEAQTSEKQFFIDCVHFSATVLDRDGEGPITVQSGQDTCSRLKVKIVQLSIATLVLYQYTELCKAWAGISSTFSHSMLGVFEFA